MDSWGALPPCWIFSHLEIYSIHGFDIMNLQFASPGLPYMGACMFRAVNCILTVCAHIWNSKSVPPDVTHVISFTRLPLFSRRAVEKIGAPAWGRGYALYTLCNMASNMTCHYDSIAQEAKPLQCSPQHT